MELKTKYQYTYFIYPYIVQENKYDKYLFKLLNHKNCKVRFFEKEKDMDLYNYFLPKIKDFMFQGFEFSKDKISKFEKFNKEMQAIILSKYPTTIFEYDIGTDVQGKAGEDEGIFFHLQKMQIVCFNTGICFLVMKTNIEESNDFRDVLDFNYKFRDIYSELNGLKKYENIRLQTATFSDVKKLKDLIKELTGNVEDAKSLNIDTNRFLTYAYTCLEQEYWKDDRQFKNIEFEFFKYANIFPSSYKSNFDKKHMEILSKWRFIRTGFTKEGIGLLTSGIDIHNYTRLPYLYENQYLYTYILAQYQKIYLKKLENEAKNKALTAEAREKFIKFTKELWIGEVTNDDVGTNIYKKTRQVCEVQKLYEEVKNKFDIAYKELNIEKETRVNKIILVILCVSLLLNIINFIGLLNMM
jgi:hypothetical protein